MRFVLLIAALCGGCATGKGDVSPTPSWATTTGRDEAKLQLAAALLDNGNAEAALQLIGQMRSQGVKGPEISVLQGRALADVGLSEDAERVLSQVARRHPSNIDASNGLGIIYMDDRRIDEAIGRFRQAARAAPKNAAVHNNLGFALMSAGRHAEAVEVLRKALFNDASVMRTRNNLGFALVATGQDKAAWRVFRAGSDKANARYNLALAQEVRGDKEAAIVSYTAALVDNPDMALAQAALERLNRASITEPEAKDDEAPPPGVSSTPEETTP
jgi:Flp pilus assembly protein TadD